MITAITSIARVAQICKRIPLGRGEGTALDGEFGSQMGADGGRCDLFAQFSGHEELAPSHQKRLKHIPETVLNSSNHAQNRAGNVPNVKKPYGKPSEEPFKR